MINHLEDIKIYVMKNGRKRIVLGWNTASFHISKKMSMKYVIAQKTGLLQYIFRRVFHTLIQMKEK
jgi:hypothetical protein